MRFKIGAVALVIFAAGFSATAQKRVVTNADLERYKQDRMRAEREYRDNYERLGQPSPEELARRNEESRKNMLQLAEQLRGSQRERERIESEREQAAAEYWAAASRQSVAAPGYYNPYGFSGGYGGFYSTGFGGRFINTGGRRGLYPAPGQPFQQPYYVGGGSIWPIGTVGPLALPTSRPQITIQGPRRH